MVYIHTYTLYSIVQMNLKKFNFIQNRKIKFWIYRTVQYSMALPILRIQYRL